MKMSTRARNALPASTVRSSRVVGFSSSALTIDTATTSNPKMAADAPALVLKKLSKWSTTTHHSGFEPGQVLYQARFGRRCVWLGQCVRPGLRGHEHGSRGKITGVARTCTPWGPWDPASPLEVADIFSGCQAHWWIAGGHAIELAAGKQIREHGDIDILLLRRDQFAVQRVLPDWQWQAADPPGTLRPWLPAERLPASVHDIWCRPGPSEPWRIQVMLDESSGTEWVSRWDQRVRRPIASIGSVTASGIPYLAPEIQLFYKGKGLRPKDEADFAAVLPMLTRAQRDWLSDTLGLVYGPGHPWLARLLARPGATQPGDG
jgi:hypothetical protein